MYHPMVIVDATIESRACDIVGNFIMKEMHLIVDILGDDYHRFNHEFNLAKISYEERSLSSTRGSKVSDI